MMSEQKTGCLDPNGNFVESLLANRPVAYRCYVVPEGCEMTEGYWAYREDEPTAFGRAYAESEGLIWEPLYAAPACVSEEYINSIKADLQPQDKLHTAAPDLLQSLESLTTAIDQYFGPSKVGPAFPKFFDSEMYSARQAIAKAKGN